MSDSNSDPFVALDVPRQFDLDDATLVAARDRTGNTAAYQSIATPRARAESLMRLIGGPTAGEYPGLPNGFADQFAQTHGDAAAVAALRAERWNNITHLFPQLLGFDKAPVQIARAKMMRAELNAIDALK
ncbi:MAG: hypothetical protein JO353_02250 [Phycisphaerae bacterium]|nr:hypothetical protein [Phycisphaerae bacterium]